MKAKEFKKYQNYALYIRIHDMDYEFNEDGCRHDYITESAYTLVPYTKEELEPLWDKEVISFYMKPSNISWGNGEGPQELHLNVSRFNEKERGKIARDREIKLKTEELERLTGKKVTLNDKEV